MDLLDFEPGELYYQKEDSLEVQELIKQAGESYSHGEAELPLLKAFLQAPDSLNVLIALNRFYYYQHRLAEALTTSQHALHLIANNLDFPDDWQLLNLESIKSTNKKLISWVRLYLFTLKSIGFLKMRMHDLDASKCIFEKLTLLDIEDRIGAKGLLEMVNRKIDETNHIFHL